MENSQQHEEIVSLKAQLKSLSQPPQESVNIFINS